MSHDPHFRTSEAQPQPESAARLAPVSRANYFSDEVAIDFPSVGAVLERLRANITERDAATSVVSTEIRLSPREAGQGALVPLDVPLRRTCGGCGGRGEIWMEPCETCAGSGHCLLQHHVRVSVPAGVRDGSLFRFSIGHSSAPPTVVDVRIAIR